MPISCQIVADSLNSVDGSRLTTCVLRYPRFVHAELMTHRLFSRNASSSRAIPAEKFIAMVQSDPAMPVEWGANNPGMQSKALLPPEVAAQAERVWLKGRDLMVGITEELVALGVHKQLANRALEPWHWITVLLTGTDRAYANFFGLRAHGDAQPEIRELAKCALVSYMVSQPKTLKLGEWHTPFVTDLVGDDAVKASVARCARVSYLNHDGSTPDLLKDIGLHDRLVGGQPKHASPAEHQAQVYPDATKLSGNLDGAWLQYRKTLPGECITNIPAYSLSLAKLPVEMVNLNGDIERIG